MATLPHPNEMLGVVLEPCQSYVAYRSTGLLTCESIVLTISFKRDVFIDFKRCPGPFLLNSDKTSESENQTFFSHISFGSQTGSWRAKLSR